MSLPCVCASLSVFSMCVLSSEHGKSDANVGLTANVGHTATQAAKVVDCRASDDDSDVYPGCDTTCGSTWLSQVAICIQHLYTTGLDPSSPFGQPQLNVPERKSHPRGKPLQPRFPGPLSCSDLTCYLMTKVLLHCAHQSVAALCACLSLPSCTILHPSW